MEESGVRMTLQMLLSNLIFLFLSTFFFLKAQAAPILTEPAFVDLKILQKLNITALHLDKNLGIGFTKLTTDEKEKISQYQHSIGGCGGFESLPTNTTLAEAQTSLGQLQKYQNKIKKFRPSNWRMQIEPNPKIIAALEKMNVDNLKANIEWISAYPSRDHRRNEPNAHVIDWENRAKKLLEKSALPYQIDRITHSSTRQQSIRISIPGTDRKNEIIVLGAHFDSINHQSNGMNRIAPGADDNASGSANLMEALRVFSENGQQSLRTIDFIWYAGEETGLLGSSEIAKTYKKLKKDVVGALQLDMNLYPGSGENIIANTTDYTHPWLQNYLKEVSRKYLNVRFIDRTCGYACSDHASWHRQGFPAVMPFEAGGNSYNKRLHTESDILDSRSSLNHALNFGKLAVLLAMEFGNRTERPE